jgi:hypothetical protein
MEKLRLHVELPEGADSRAVAAELQRRLAVLDEVDQAAARPESTRLAAEIIAGIAITVSLVKGAGDLADALHHAIPKIKLVLQDLGLTRARVEVAGEQVPLEQINRSHTERIAAG